MNTSVSFELAKLLKEKGYDEPCALLYDENGKISGTKMSMAGHPNIYINKYSAPIIAEVLMWFYEKHGIWVKVDVASKDFWHPSILNIEDGNFLVHPSFVSQNFIEKNERMFKTPTEAYESTILYTLNNLI